MRQVVPRVMQRRMRLLAIVSMFSFIFLFFAVQNDYVTFTCDLKEELPIWAEKYESLHPENINEILRILQTTPNLLGYRGQEFGTDDTVATRVKAQQEWVKQISETTFIKNAKRKILLYLDSPGGDEYKFSGTQLKCPYAPNFEVKCNLVLEEHNQSRQSGQPPPQYLKDLEIDAVIGIRNGYYSGSEPTFPPGVRQILYTVESPCHSKSAWLGKNGAWLASYWRGADIPFSYYQYVKTATKSNSRRRSAMNDSIPVGKDNRKLVVAMISNGYSVKNNRMGYITELQNYIDVDVFGRRGNNICPTTGDCLQHLGSRYKFYLAFENCNCEDYVTEKFFVNALKHNMVPVVMGAKPENYASAAPPHSFIHVNDFSSPKELAQYLQRLDKNDELYQKYLKWKTPDPSSEAVWELSTASRADFFCRACGLLYYADFKPPPPYQSCSTRWKDLNECLPKNVWNWPS